MTLTPLPPKTLAWLRQTASLDGSTYSRVLQHILERLDALEARPIAGTVELAAAAENLHQQDEDAERAADPDEPQTFHGIALDMVETLSILPEIKRVIRRAIQEPMERPASEPAPVATDEELKEAYARASTRPSGFRAVHDIGWDLGFRHGAAQAALTAMPLIWTENLPPNEECRYDHCKADTPFGRFLITWKSWKQYDSPTVDETPWGVFWSAFESIERAKEGCQEEYEKRLRDCCAAPLAAAQPSPRDPASVAPLLWLLWNHQGSGSRVGQPIRRYLGMGQFQGMTKEQIEAAKGWGSIPFPVQPSPPAGGLVDRVESRAGGDGRAAVHAVADWLVEQAPEPGLVGKWLGQVSTPFAVIADMLREEANR